MSTTIVETVALRSHATAPASGDTRPEFWPATAPLLSVRRTPDGQLLPGVDARRAAARLRRTSQSAQPSITPGFQVQTARASSSPLARLELAHLRLLSIDLQAAAAWNRMAAAVCAAMSALADMELRGVHSYVAVQAQRYQDGLRDLAPRAFPGGTAPLRGWAALSDRPAIITPVVSQLQRTYEHVRFLMRAALSTMAYEAMREQRNA